jgi:hypothetical protein
MDPELYVQRLLDDEGLTSDLDEADAMALLAGLTQRVEEAVRQRTANDAWVNQLAQRGRIVAQIVALARAHQWDAAKQLARTHQLRWPTKTENLVAELLAQDSTP